MAKRFIDNEILPKAFRKLEPSLKLTWYYIWTHCDKSGVWDIDEDLFEFDNGFEFNLKKFEESFATLINVLKDKILLIDFIKVNYGTLTENYNPHKPVFRDLLKNNLKLEPSSNQAYFKLVDEKEDVDIYEEEVKEEKEPAKKIIEIGTVYEVESGKPKKAKAKVQKSEVDLPFETEKFKVQWQLWKAYKAKEHKFNYKSIESEQASLTELTNLSNGLEETAILIMNQSMAKGWKGFFELKNNYQHGAPEKPTGGFNRNR
ncbi:hypothetical protein [Flavobacterium hungaricum]|uniref:Uncharacterized protein n=1 Tax=Flavobacterium hungaricum TaxID=2082725 RepID=A0ABR9TRG9_9FLAO|nr:hypothetical protein [Flavobacterium hungaricum]MBE8727955.1 hypothetical protein [Flavobacterium hungaricum]